MLLTVCVVFACKQASAGTLLQHVLSNHQFMAPTERCAMVCCAYQALCTIWFAIIAVYQHSHTDELIVTADAVANHCCKHQLASVAGRWHFMTALQPMTCQKLKHACVDIQHASLAQQLLQNYAIVLPRITSHAELVSCPEFADILINACKPAVRVLLCRCGLLENSWISILQRFASNVLISIAVCMGGSASCTVICLYLQSETCIVTIILMGQA